MGTRARHAGARSRDMLGRGTRRAGPPLFDDKPLMARCAPESATRPTTGVGEAGEPAGEMAWNRPLRGPELTRKACRKHAQRTTASPTRPEAQDPMPPPPPLPPQRPQ